jgi:hemerythrin superfamily protein
MTSLTQQDTQQLGGSISVLTRQRRDHIKLDRLLGELRAAPPAQQNAVLRRIYRLVFPHAFAEESVLWPVMRAVLPDGERLTLQVEQEHQEVNELVTSLEGTTADDPGRAAIIDRLVQVLREDVRDEEDVLLPRLQDRLSRRRLQLLGLAWEVVRRTAPTRAHPIVARRPPGNVIAAAPLALIDRLRDCSDRVLQSEPSRGAATLKALSRGLTGLAHRVEHLPGMKRGEHPSTRRESAATSDGTNQRGGGLVV